jgi:endoglucanase
MRRWVFLLLMGLLAGCAAPDPFRASREIGRGINLGNALDAPSEGAWGVTLEADYFRIIREAGFDSVRIPIRWSAHAEAAAPFIIDSAFFARVDWAVASALSNQLAVVLNVHHYVELMQDPAANRERFLALWKQIAEHYRNAPPRVLFEILNEPNGALNPELWNEILGEAVRVIRKTNPKRTLIVDAPEWANMTALGKLMLPPGDRNLIVSAHCYIPFEFTHQGAEWINGSSAWRGRTWTGTDSEKRELASVFDAVAGWARTNRVPVYLGEFGAYKTADMESRARWTAFIARQAQARDFSWSYWEFCSGFGAYDAQAKQWRLPLLHSLIPAPSEP